MKNEDDPTVHVIRRHCPVQDDQTPDERIARVLRPCLKQVEDRLYKEKGVVVRLRARITPPPHEEEDGSTS